LDRHAQGILARSTTPGAADVGPFVPSPFLSPRLDRLIKRVFSCPEPWAVPSVRHVDPGATFLTHWSDFAAAFPEADVGVVLCPAQGEHDLAARLSELTRSHRLPSVVVVTHLDVEHLVAFRRILVDEFVQLASMARDLPEAVLRSVIAPLRERLALHLERLERCGPELRFALGCVLRQPTGIKTIRGLAAAACVTPRTLQNQWKALHGGAEGMRLEDVLWMTRLLEALELRATGVSLRCICEALDVDLRSLQRACRRHLGSALGRVSATEATAELLELRRRILKACGFSVASRQVQAVWDSPLAPFQLFGTNLGTNRGTAMVATKRPHSAKGGDRSRNRFPDRAG